MIQDPKIIARTKPLSGSVCEVRTDLLDQLANAVERLGRAKLTLLDCLDDEVCMPGEFVTGEVEELRKACGFIRAKLEHHRASHGC